MTMSGEVTERLKTLGVLAAIGGAFTGVLRYEANRVFFMGSSLPEGPFSEVSGGAQIA